MINTVIIDAQEQARYKVASLLSAESDIKVAAIGKDAYDALKFTGCLKPDILVIDNNLGHVEGGEIFPLLRMRSSSTMMILLAGKMNDSELLRAISNKVVGFIDRENDLNILPQALKHIYKGGCFISPALAGRVLSLVNLKNLWHKINPYAAKKKLPLNQIAYSDDPVGYLSKTELQILTYLSEGLSSKEIAVELNLVIGTVRNNISFLINKLGVKSRTQLVHYAYSHGLVIP